MEQDRTFTLWHTTVPDGTMRWGRGSVFRARVCCTHFLSTICKANMLAKAVLLLVLCYVMFQAYDNYPFYFAQAWGSSSVHVSAQDMAHQYPPIPDRVDPASTFPANLSHAPCVPRIYVYPMATALNPLHSVGKTIDHCPLQGSLAYQSEFVLYKRLVEPGEFNSLYVTDNPQQATHYYVPFFGACHYAYFCAEGEGSSTCDMSGYAEAVFAHLDTLPYLKRARERHMVVHPMDAVTAYYGDKSVRFDGLVQIVTNGDKRGVLPMANRHPHWKHTITIPSTSNPIVRAGGDVRFLPDDGAFGNRVFQVMFRGLLRNGPFEYSHGVRSYLADHFTKLPGWTLAEGTGTRAYQKTLARSIFGLSPEGWTLDTTRTWDYLAYGVIPVIISDGIDLPFEDDLDWYRFSVRVHREDVPILPQIISRISPQSIKAMQQAIWDNARYCLVEQGAWHYIARQLCRIADTYDPQTLPIKYPLTWKKDFWNQHDYL